MTLPTTEHIAELSHAELVVLVKELITAVQRWEAENRQLRTENQQIKAEEGKEPLPPLTSRTPRSRRHEIEAESRGTRKRKKHGPPFGHAPRHRCGSARGPDDSALGAAVPTVRRPCIGSSRGPSCAIN